MRPILIALALALLGAAPVDADSYTYDVRGTLSITGNDTCGGPCVQRLQFAFLFEWVPAPDLQYGRHPGDYIGRWLPSTNVVSTGPLDNSFTLHGGGGSGLPYWMGFYNAGGDEIDLLGGWWANSTPWTAPSFGPYSEMYGCFSQACIEHFSPFGEAFFGPMSQGTLQITATRVAEPVSLLLVGLGLAGLAGARRARWI